jgi:superfamily II DNA or RNA helicase
MIVPRAYQVEAVESVFKKWRAYNSTLLVSATGTGKTVCCGLIASRIPKDRRMLVLVNQTELMFQMHGALTRMLPDDVVEMESGDLSGTHVSPGSPKTCCGRVVVGMLQTLANKKRLLSWHPQEFSHIIADEAAHYVTVNPSSRHVLDHFQDYKLCGLTATPDRLDGVSLSGYFKSVAYNYDIQNAIADGWLVPIRQEMETVVGWDLSELKRKKGDFASGDLDSILNKEKPSQAIASAAIKWAEADGSKKPCLIFAVSVAHAHLIADILNRPRGGIDRAGCAVALDGGVDRLDRKSELARFKAGEFQYLVGADLFLEGFDEDSIEVIVMGRPTASRSRYSQAIGRGTRPHHSIVDALNAAGSAEERRFIIRTSLKSCLTVVDMVGVSAHLKLIVNAVDILGGWLPQRVRDKAKDLIRDGMGKPDVDLVLKEAIAILNQAEKDRRRGLVIRAHLESRAVDPFDWLDVKPKREPMVLRGKPATPRMIAVLQANDIPTSGFVSFWTAKQLIGAIMKERNAGPPSEAMARLLVKFGAFRDGMDYKDAKKAIDELAADGWKER